MTKIEKILFVDDEADLVELIPEILAETGVACIGCASVAGAIEQLKSHSFTAILSDLKMPGHGGQVLLKKCLALKNRPLFFFLTGNIQFSHNDAIQLGADGVIYKPINYTEILEFVGKLRAS